VAVSASVATIAAATVIAVAVAGGGAAVPKPHQLARAARPARSSQSAASLTARVLATAAKTVASEPATEPGPHQWIYYRTVDATNGKITGYDDEWITFDGIDTAYYGNPGQLVTHQVPGDGYPTPPSGTSALQAWDDTAVPLTAYRALASLPTSTSALLAAVDKELTATGETTFGITGQATTTSRKEFAWLGQLIWNAYAAAPPSALAAVYQAIATIPGVTVNQNLTDADGRPAIGITDDGGAVEILLSPQTYQPVGINLAGPSPKVKAVKGKKGVVPTGTEVQSIAYLRIAEVGGPGQK
jgi:hypothetical protein